MIALVISLVIFMGLMQTSLVGINSNMRNVLREEAVSIAEVDMSAAKNTAFPPPSVPTTPVLRNFRNINNFQYTTNRAVTLLGGCNRQVNVTVTWAWKGQNFNHTTSTIVRNPTC